MICDNVFTDPVIAKCGHTFCRRCVMNMPPGEKCPLHQTALSRNVIPNLSVVEQIAELHIYCKHGLKAVPDRVGTFTRDPDGCTHTMKLGERVEHEEQCLFEPTVYAFMSRASSSPGRPGHRVVAWPGHSPHPLLTPHAHAHRDATLLPFSCSLLPSSSSSPLPPTIFPFCRRRCTNSDECGAILRRDLEQHLAECPRTKCPQSFRGCTVSLRRLCHASSGKEGEGW